VPSYDGIQSFSATGDAIQYGGPHLCAEGEFPTPDGKARFGVVTLPEPRRRQDSFIVSTRRGRQFNSLIYDNVDPGTNAARDAVLMNPLDAAALGLKNHQAVDLRNEVGVFHGRVFFAPIARGDLQVHYPEGNVLIARGVVDAGGGVPDYNARVRVSAS
jgi:anaerobic selenocysteine-containing dehydrogenase